MIRFRLFFGRGVNVSFSAFHANRCTLIGAQFQPWCYVCNFRCKEAKVMSVKCMCGQTPPTHQRYSQLFQEALENQSEPTQTKLPFFFSSLQACLEMVGRLCEADHVLCVESGGTWKVRPCMRLYSQGKIFMHGFLIGYDRICMVQWCTCAHLLPDFLQLGGWLTSQLMKDGWPKIRT